jgi:hypothetical protein
MFDVIHRFGKDNPVDGHHKHRPRDKIVLVSGDNNADGIPDPECKVRFGDILEIAIAQGFEVEVWSWAAITNKSFKEDLPAKHRALFKICYLDHHNRKAQLVTGMLPPPRDCSPAPAGDRDKSRGRSPVAGGGPAAVHTPPGDEQEESRSRSRSRSLVAGQLDADAERDFCDAVHRVMIQLESLPSSKRPFVGAYIGAELNKRGIRSPYGNAKEAYLKGLKSCRQILSDDHKGRFVVSQKPDGTDFTVDLESAGSSAAAHAPPGDEHDAPPAPIASGGKVQWLFYSSVFLPVLCNVFSLLRASVSACW